MTGAKAGQRRLPSKDDCIELLRQSGCGDDVIRHCETVSDLAVKIARKCGADVEVVMVGGMLHDLGRSKTHGIQHAVEGVKIAEEKGLPQSVLRIIERHVGAGITRAEARKLGLPEKDFFPLSLEEKVVSHADKLIDGSKRTSVKVAVSRFVRQGLPDVAMRVLKQHEELSELCGMNVDDIY